MSEYTTREYIDMVIAYGIAGENARMAARVYAERFPERERHPDHKVILRCIGRFYESGSVRINKNTEAELRIPAHVEERILQIFEENPGYSVRRVARILGVVKSTVHNILRRNGLHPYHYQQVQQLLPRDAEQRNYFCEGTVIVSLFNV